MHRGFERQAGTGRGFEEAAGDHLVFQQFRLRVGFQTGGGAHQLQILAAEIVNRDDVFVIQRVGHFHSSSTRARGADFGIFSRQKALNEGLETIGLATGETTAAGRR